MTNQRLSATLAHIAEEFIASPSEVVIVGAGDCDECAALIAVFPTSHVTAIDAVPGAVQQARRRFVSQGVEVLEGDAADILPTLPRFQVVLVRHPDVDRQPAGWAHNLTACAAYLEQGGVIVVTAYTFHEVEWLRAHIESSCPGLRLQPVDPLIPVAISGADRYILVYTKRDPEGS